MDSHQLIDSIVIHNWKCSWEKHHPALPWGLLTPLSPLPSLFFWPKVLRRHQQRKLQQEGMWRGHSVAAVAAAPPGSVHSLAWMDYETTSPDTQTAGTFA
ncbi:hypothetical protein INR49_025011, partial [Caranx melampygus]